MALHAVIPSVVVYCATDWECVAEQTLVALSRNVNQNEKKKLMYLRYDLDPDSFAHVTPDHRHWQQKNKPTNKEPKTNKHDILSGG